MLSSESTKRQRRSGSRRYRLAAKADFQAVFSKPHKVSHKGLLALFRRNDLAYPRLGIIISKNHVRRAVDRNRFRRIVRERFRHEVPTLGHIDIAILIKPEWAKLESSQRREALTNLFQSLREKAARV